MQKMDIISEKVQTEPLSTSQSEPQESDIKTRVDAVWQQMNKGVSAKTLSSIVNKPSSTQNTIPQKPQGSHNWMSFLGLGSNKTQPNGTAQAKTVPSNNGMSNEVKKLAAAALAAANDSAAACTVAQGKIEVTEVRDFAGEEIVVKRPVDPATEKAKVSASAVDAVLEQIKKRPKLNLLDKTKKDWGEFKEENKGLEEELDAYKKSSNQYLDKVDFLQKTDYREFERERDARLVQQAKRKMDMHEDL